jgi:KUP system potassium uptake protein
VTGSAVFMVGNRRLGTPLALLHHVKANRVPPKTVVLLKYRHRGRAQRFQDERPLTLRDIGEGVWRAVGRYGYMESPDVADLMEKIRAAWRPDSTREAPPSTLTAR